MMDDKEIIMAFESIAQCADSEAVERKVRENMGITNSNKQNRKFKSVLIAAAVFLIVLAVPVAAFGSVFLYSVITTENGYEIAVDGKFSPVKFSKEKEEELKQYKIVMTDSEYSKSTRETGKVFTDYNEAVEWLDCGLLTSELLVDAEKYDMVLSTILNSDNSLHNILLSGNSYVGDSSKYVMISIQIPQKYFDYSLGWKYRGSNVISEETYTTESEIDVQIVISSLDYAVAHFIHDGVKYSFTSFKSSFGGNMDDCVEMLKTLVESLE